MENNANETLKEHDRRLTEVEREIYRCTILLEQGMTGGAAREIAELKAQIAHLRTDLSTLITKTTRWEGGGGMLYIIITLVGGFIGWVLSHVGIGAK
jgi:hypothetical protein